MGQVKFTVVDRGGQARELQAAAGEVLMAPLRDGIDITIGTCGGVISCGTCVVVVDEAWRDKLPPPSQDEIEMLEALDAGPGSRLACQLPLTEALEGISLTIAPEI